jgi:plasmid maintenance system antidote protein VapI
MNARYWVSKALKEAMKDRAAAGDILAKYFTQAIDHTLREANEAIEAKEQEIEELKAKIITLEAQSANLRV